MTNDHCIYVPDKLDLRLSIDLTYVYSKLRESENAAPVQLKKLGDTNPSFKLLGHLNEN